MAKSSYRNFMRLLEKWPVDQTKTGGRDLGEYIRLQVTKGFRQGEASAVNEEECHRVYASLNRIASGIYAAKYPRSLSSTASGLSAKECHQIMSTEFLNMVKEQDKGFFQRMFKRS